MDYNIRLGIKLEENSVANIRKELNAKLKNEKIEISFSSKGLDEISKKLDDISSRLGNVSKKNGFEDVSGSAKQASKGVDKLNGSLEKTTKHIKNQTFATDNWAYNWSKAMQSFLTYNTVTQFFNTVVNGIKDMIGEVKELDDSLTELKKVTDLEGESLDRFVGKAYKTGEEVAKTGKEMVDAATSFAKAGYDESDILQLGEVAAMYTNIADEEISTADAADFVIAQLKAFKLESKDTTKTLENAYHVIDAVNEVSNNFAVSSSDIATNMGKASAVMANAGNSMEQMIGLMTAGTEITRNASKVANGLKTITLRLQGMDDEGNKSLELQAQMEGLFNKLGISVYDANGELKNTYDILSTLAPVYDKLSNAEKAYVTETIAGKYQAQNAAAILSNWKTAVEATTTALDSNGSASKENSKVLQSVEGHLQNLRAAWSELSNQIVSSEGINKSLSLITSLLKFASSGMGQFLIKTVAYTAALRVLGTVFLSTGKHIKNFATGIVSTIKEIKNFSNAILLLNNRQKLQAAQQAINNKDLSKAKSYLQQAGIATDGLTKKKQIQDVVNKKLAASSLLLNSALAAGTLIISGLMALYSNYKQKQEEISEKNQELVDSVIDGNSKIQTQKDELKDLLKQYEDLKKNNKIGDNEETKALEQSINEILKTRKTSVDLINGSYEKQKGIISGIVDELDKASQKELERAKIAAEAELNKADKKVEKSNVGVLMGQYQLVADTPNYFDFNEMDVENKLKELKKLQDYITDKYNDENHNWSKREKENMQDQLAIINEETDRLEGAYNKVNEINQRIEDIDLKDALKDSFKIDAESGAKEVSNFIDEVKKSTKYTDEQKERLYELAKDIIPDYSDSLNEAQGALDDTDKYINNADDGICTLKDNMNDMSGASKSIEEAETILSSYSAQLDDITNKYNILTSAVDEYNDAGYLSSETLKQITDNGLLEYLNFENGHLVANTSELYNNAEAARITASQKLAGAMADDMLAIAEGNVENASSFAQSAVAGLGNSATTAGNQAANATGQFISFAQAVDQANQALEGKKITGKVQGQLDAVKNAYKSAFSVISKPVNIKPVSYSGSGSGGSGGGRGGSGGGSKSSKSEKAWWEKQYDKLKDQLDNSQITINQYINGLNKILKKTKKGSEAWKKINKELQKAKLDKLKDDYDAGRISLNKYIKELGKLQKAYKKGTEGWRNLAKEIKKAKLEKLKKQQDAIKDALSAVNHKLDKQKEKYEKAKEAAEKKYDTEIEKLEKLQDKLDDDDDKYQRAQEAAADFLDKQREAIEKQRDAAESYYDSVIEAIETMNEKQSEAVELAEAYEALMNAMSQKTKKVYKEGLGWVWTTDAEAIREAKKNYEDLLKNNTVKDIEEQKDKTVKSLEDQINTLQEYIDSWDKVLDKFENEKNRNFAQLLLGDNWEEMLDKLDPQVVEDFSNAYYDLQKNLEDTENQIEKLNEQRDIESERYDNLIEKLEEYQDRWDDVADEYQYNQDKLMANQVLGKNWESQILAERLEAVNKFAAAYKKIWDEVSKVENMSDDKASTYTPKSLPGFAQGGEVDYTGLAMLHGTPNKPEYVLNNTQMKNLLGNLTKPGFKSNFKNSGNSSINNYNFGNIELPNVTNAHQFANELQSLLNITKNQ